MHYDWQDLIRQVAACDRCLLCQTRTHPAFGEGNPNAMVMLVGEGPGRDEDLTGRPFVGPAGQLLDRMLAAIDIRREDVYIANVVKCRPPNNRNPEPEEARACLPYLRGQFALVR
ncbi:MAG: uracil-DNA glycosylase, partial [Clostridia bacterium]|nr:uracil-DNA glycosylase [Clostridia bacterium]